MRSSVLGAAMGILALAGLVGCAQAVAPAPVKVAQVESPVADNADTVAQRAVDGRVTVTLHVDRLLGFRFSKRLVSLGGWDDALTGTGVDPLLDVQRAFITSHSSHDGDVAIVLQHTAPEEKVAEAIRGMGKRWAEAHKEPTRDELDARIGDGQTYDIDWALPGLSDLPFPATYRRMKNDFAHIDGPVVIAAPHPGLLVVLPAHLSYSMPDMVDAGGLPGPSGGEAMVFRAWLPEYSIQSGPSWSHEVKYAEAVFTFDAEGNSSLKFRAVCTSPEAAKAEAERMTNQVEDAQSVKIAGARLRLFDYIEFHAERERVQMTTRLFADDVDWLVAMGMKRL